MTRTVQHIEPSQDFVYLISGEITPELYGRDPALDTQDREMWSELVWLRRRMMLRAALPYVLGFAFLAAAIASIFVIVV